MKKRRLVLHLGLWKTGTTTIQSFLRRNPEILAEIGVHYPQVGPENPDHPFFKPRPPTDFLADEVSHQFLGRELVIGKRPPPVGLPLWSTALRQFENSGAHTAIVSYEDFSAQVSLYHFELIADLVKQFEVVGIIYLRPQESWAISLYSHFIRSARTQLGFGGFKEGIQHRLTYSKLLDRILAQAPIDRLIVRNFDEAVKTGLIPDFFHSLDLVDAFSASGADHPAKNKSLPQWALLFLLKCIQSSIPSEQLADVRQALTKSVAIRRAPQLRPGLDLASPAERSELRAMMDADAGRLARKYAVRFAKPGPATSPYRPFDRDDFDTIKETITPRLALPTRLALSDL